MAPFAAYVRVSRVGDRAERLISPELQLSRIRSYAESRGIEVAEAVEAELDVSGGKFHRPVLDRILRGIESGEFCGLIVSQQDRLSRMGVLDTLRLIDRIESLGGTFISCAENIDASTRSGKLTRNLFSSIAEHELDRYREQFREAKERAVRAGIWPSPRVPYGYRLATRRLHPDPEKASILHRGFEARAAGAAWSEVAHLLDRPISTTTKIIRSRVYLGEIHLGEFVNRKAHPPIVDRALWEAAQMKHPRPVRTGEPALLGGLIRCAGCRGRMTPSKNGRGTLYYGCAGKPKVGGRCAERAHVRRDVADAFVEGVVLSYFEGGHVEVSDKTAALEEASATLGQAEAELVEYQEVTRVVGQRDSFLAGMKSRIEAVEAARGKLASTRVSAPLPTSLEWDDLSVKERRHVLSRSLSVVWCKRGGSMRVIAKGHFEVPPHGSPVVPLDWTDGEFQGQLGMTG